jgi:hypothetical protein
MAVRRRLRQQSVLPRLIAPPPSSAAEMTMVHPSAKKRGADPHVPRKPKHKRPKDPLEKKLEQGLEESMAGSDPVSVTQPAPRHPPAKDDDD